MPDQIRKVRVLFNLKSGAKLTADAWLKAFQIIKSFREEWDVPGIDITVQESRSAEDGQGKTQRAIDDGVDTIIVVGGDGMVNSIGKMLINTNVALGVIPTGSGNGFARHFGIPLNPGKAVEVLSKGKRQAIDVGTAAGHPFFITSSFAWDADLVRGFQESQVRGIFPYIFASISHFFTYDPQRYEIEVDGEKLNLSECIVLTVANLTQFGGGAKIAPQASPDDGLLNLVAVPKLDPVNILSKVHKLFDGTVKEIEEIKTWSFKKLVIRRERPDPIQVDGELVEAAKEFNVEIKEKALNVLVPSEPVTRRTAWSIEDFKL